MPITSPPPQHRRNGRQGPTIDPPGQTKNPGQRGYDLVRDDVSYGWRPGCPRMTASRSIPLRRRSSTPPGSAARTVGPVRGTAWPPGSAATPHAEWFYGFRLAIKADLGSRVIRAWGIVPAAVNERDVADDLLATGPPPRDLLLDKGFAGAAFAAGQAARGTAVLIPPIKGQRHALQPLRRAISAKWRNRTEPPSGEIPTLMELARHGAHTFSGLLTRAAATIAAHTLMPLCLTDA